MSLNNQYTQSIEVKLDENDEFAKQRERAIEHLTERIRAWVEGQLTRQFTASDTRFASIEFSAQAGDGYMVFPTIGVEETKSEDL